MPENPLHLYQSLREQGYIWIGYTMSEACVRVDKLGQALDSLFPRQTSFTCHRQNQIIINPNGNPFSQKAWEESRDKVVELITLGGDD
ncbi:MAG: hypothetical protein Q9M75_05615, partial [Ghiorsea sp.]|nr:hypothetical protein [Ghiorsea sp.]